MPLKHKVVNQEYRSNLFDNQKSIHKPIIFNKQFTENRRVRRSKPITNMDSCSCTPIKKLNPNNEALRI